MSASANSSAASKYHFGIPSKKNFQMGCKNSKSSKKLPKSHDVPLEPEMPREPEMSQSISFNQTDESDSYIEITDDEKNSESLVGKPKELRSSSESQNISSKTAGHNATKSDDDDVKLQNDLTVVDEASADGEENSFNEEAGLGYDISEEEAGLVSKIEPVGENDEVKIDLDESSVDFDTDDMTMTELKDLKYTEETGDNSTDSEISTEDSSSDTETTSSSKSSASEASGVVITTL